jgi:signal transduction histidine kinase
MRTRPILITLFSIAAVVVFAYVLRQLSLVSVGLAANEESQAILRRSLEDQRLLARLDPAQASEYRRRFEERRTLLRRLEILALTRQRLTRQFEIILTGLVAVIVATALAAYFLEMRSRAQRLARLSSALQSLSRGDTAIDTGDRGRDVIGQIASMIEETSRVIGKERKRVQVLEHLSSWQEAARRHAHEMRTPLTAAHMEVSRLIRNISLRLPDAADELRDAEASILEELEQLRRFTSNFVAFASAGAPQLRKRSVPELVNDFCSTFAPNWPSLTLMCQPHDEPLCAMVDREMLRQVLVNLCNNSALAIAGGRGHVRFSVTASAGNALVDVSDDGPGIPDEVKRRLFEPYTTTRRIGEGMGLGLAISKKIMLDHGGDLELVSSSNGAAFRLTLPAVVCD